MTERVAKAQRERKQLLAKYPDEFRLGYRAGFRGAPDSPCEIKKYPPAYPQGFPVWPLDRRNVWWADINMGLVDREKLIGEVGVDE
jgi:hypothetical protein